MHRIPVPACLLGTRHFANATVWLQLTVLGHVKTQSLRDRIRHWLVNLEQNPSWGNKQSLR